MVELKEGDEAPDFSLNDGEGNTVSLDDFSDKKLVLYFYPKDDTPGCTKEACGFRDSMERVASAGAAVVGVSPDDAASHGKFSEKYDLNFPLLVDAGHKVADLYGAWGKKQFMGKEYDGIIRSTFVIVDGKIAKAWYKVKVPGHVDEVLSFLGG